MSETNSTIWSPYNHNPLDYIHCEWCGHIVLRERNIEHVQKHLEDSQQETQRIETLLQRLTENKTE